MNEEGKCIFVIGDLVIDHVIFVRSDTLRPHQAKEGESIYEVLGTQTTAGGAANCARLLSSLSDGKTFLWGITGKSEYGSYRDILDYSYMIDRATSQVDLWGIDAETDAPMHCISRIISVKGNPPNYNLRSHKFRYDNYCDLHVPDSKRPIAMDDIEHANKTHNIDAIIINDLELDCLNHQMIKDIAEYAKAKQIPLLIDPKRDPSRYKNIEALAIMPNLYEWCHLVDDAKRIPYWRNRIASSSNLAEMAEISFYNMPNFNYHVIKCDSEGALIFASNVNDKLKASVYRVKPAQTASNQSFQLGCGDVMIASLALFLSGNSLCTDEFVSATAKANIVVGCYRDQLWHRMPSKRSVSISFENALPDSYIEKKDDFFNGFSLLPISKEISLSRLKTKVPNLISASEEFQSVIDLFLTEFKNNPLQHFLIAAPSGCGKSTILEYVRSEASCNRIKVEDYSGKLHEFGESPKDKLSNLFKKLRKKVEGIIIVADEGLKSSRDNEYIKRIGPILLDTASEIKIGFFIIDTLLHPSPEEIIGAEVSTRCKHIILQPLSFRPIDIAYIFASALMKSFKITSLKIEGRVLLATIYHVLSQNDPSPRTIVNLTKQIARSIAPIKPEKISYSHLPKDVQRHRSYDHDFGLFTFNA